LILDFSKYSVKERRIFFNSLHFTNETLFLTSLMLMNELQIEVFKVLVLVTSSGVGVQSSD
jgi:hypothetical protein